MIWRCRVFYYLARPANDNLGAAAAWTFGRIAAFSDTDPLATSAYFQDAQVRNDWKLDIATDEQLQRTLDLVEQGLKEGGLGIGFVYGYAPGAGTKEMVALCQLAAEYGLPTFTHSQNFSVLDPTSSIDSYVKLIGLAASTGAHMHICHMNSTSSRDIDKAVVLLHHQRFDGTGFPDKLSGDDIPEGARILAVVEALEDFRMSTGLRGEDLIPGAIREIKGGRGTRFDPDAVDLAVELLETQQGIW